MLNPFKRLFSPLEGDTKKPTGEKLSPEEIDAKKKKLKEANARMEAEEETPVHTLENPAMEKTIAEYKKRQQELEGKKTKGEDVAAERTSLFGELSVLAKKAEGEEKRTIEEMMQNVARL